MHYRADAAVTRPALVPRARRPDLPKHDCRGTVEVSRPDYSHPPPATATFANGITPASSGLLAMTYCPASPAAFFTLCWMCRIMLLS